MRAKDGSYRWILDHAKVVGRAHDGRPLRMSGTHMDVTDRKCIEQERDQLIRSLQEALQEIRTLQGIIPICSYCHRIRDEEGAWDKLEEYLAKHSNAEFSHGICPACYDEVIENIEQKENSSESQ
jgi:PAS domain-containing protein